MALREAEGEAGLDLGDVLGPSSEIATRQRLTGWRGLAVGLAVAEGPRGGLPAEAQRRPRVS